jgi:hypothetical protein
MTTFYIDPDNGSDAAVGTAFATAWKTVNSGATAARIAPGDIIRIKESPAPADTGVVAIFTNKSSVITRSSGTGNMWMSVIENFPSTGWTAGTTNVTITTTTGKNGVGTSAHVFSTNSSFTTGKVAYKTPSLPGSGINFSDYQALNLWIKSSTTIASGTFRFCLCSDTLGDVIVESFTITSNIVNNARWTAIVKDKGSALSSTPIYSYAIYAIPGATGAYTNVSISDVFVSKTPSSATSISLYDLVGKNNTTLDTEDWYAINIPSWGGTAQIGTITSSFFIDQHPNNTTTAKGYYGTSETVPLWKRNCFRLDPVTLTTSANITNDTGTSGNLIAYTGGWNASDMSFQNDYTWFDGQNGQGYGFNLSSSFNKIERMNMVRYNENIRVSAASCEILNCLGAHGENHGISTASGATSLVLSGTNRGHSNAGSGFTFISTSLSSFATAIGWANSLNGFTFSGTIGPVRATIIKGLYNSAQGIQLAPGVYESIIVKDNSTSGGTLTTTVAPTYIKSLVTQDNVSRGFRFDLSYKVTVLNWSSTGNGTPALDISASTPGDITLYNFTAAEATKLPNLDSGSYDYTDIRINSQDEGGTVGNHFIRTDRGSIQSETGADRHTASGLAWKFNITSSNRNINYPLSLPIAKIAVNSGSLVTVKVWVKRMGTVANQGARIRILGGKVSGVPNDVITNSTAATGVYEEITVVCTPSAAGVLEVLFDTYWIAGATPLTSYIDDMTISQA